MSRALLSTERFKHGPASWREALRLPPGLAPAPVELNQSGAPFSTEVFPTPPFIPVRETIRERIRNGGQ